MATATPAYDALAARQRRLYRLQHLQALAHWDQATGMPPAGNEARAAALAELAALMHRLQTDDAQRAELDAAGGEALDEWQRANLREIRREWQLATALPDALVEAKSIAASRCEHAWRSQRPANDWAGFLANFRPLLALAREEAARLSDALGCSRYDALLQRFEPGMRTDALRALFDDLKRWLPALLAEVQQRQAGDAVIAPRGPFPKDAQKRLSLDVMALLGFDFQAGRLDESAHPFTGGVPEDVRLTTRYRDDDFVQSLMGTVHETGHARYEQGLPAAWRDQPVGRARSMGVHESQSLAFEMQLGRSRPFAAQLAPLLVTHFGAQPAFEPDNLYRLLTRVRPGLIRVEADELSYPAHVILRFEIERALIEGEIEAEDIPALWDEGMQSLLGLDTRGNVRDGCLQDVHWPEGLFGYFPCYTLGALLAAQWFAALRREQPAFDARLAAGDLSPVFDGLRERVWQPASRWSTDELVRRGTGEPLGTAAFQAHLRARYLA